MSTRVMMTPDELRDAATNMRKRLEAITSELNQLKSKVDDTATRWDGKAKNSYVPKFNDVHQNMQKALNEAINGLSKALDESARGIEEVDSNLANSY